MEKGVYAAGCQKVPARREKQQRFLPIIAGLVSQHEDNAKAAADDGDEEDSGFPPLTAQEAAEWRKRHPSRSVWPIVWGQVAAGVVVALLAWWLTGSPEAGWSAGYGALSAVLPAMLLARGMGRGAKDARGAAHAALATFFAWELVKIVLTIAMLLAAPRLVPQLNWLALLAGMVVTMKTYWVALLVPSGVRKNV